MAIINLALRSRYVRGQDQILMYGAQQSILGTQLAECSRRKLLSLKDEYYQSEEFAYMSVIRGFMQIIWRTQSTTY